MLAMTAAPNKAEVRSEAAARYIRDSLVQNTLFLNQLEAGARALVSRQSIEGVTIGDFTANEVIRLSQLPRDS